MNDTNLIVKGSIGPTRKGFVGRLSVSIVDASGAVLYTESMELEPLPSRREVELAMDEAKKIVQEVMRNQGIKVTELPKTGTGIFQ